MASTVVFIAAARRGDPDCAAGTLAGQLYGGVDVTPHANDI